MNPEFMGTLPQWLQFGLAAVVALIGAVKGWHALSNESRVRILAVAVLVFPYPVAICVLMLIGMSSGTAALMVIPVGACFQVLTKHNATILKYLSRLMIDDR